MPAAAAYGERPFTLTDVLVAQYIGGVNTYGTPAALSDGQTVEIEPISDTVELKSYGVMRAKATVITSAKFKISAGAYDASVIATLVGATVSESGATGSKRRRLNMGSTGASLPYFGMIGLGEADAGGYAAVGLCYGMLDSMPKISLDGASNKFSVSEMSGVAVWQTLSGTDYLGVIKAYETKSLWTAPASAANFLAFFTTDGG